MKTIYLDEFTNLIAIGCSKEEANIDYFDSVEEALKIYPDAFVDPSLSELRVSIANDVCIELTNQKVTLTKEQAITLREILFSI